MATATVLKQNWGGFPGDHCLYQLSSPLSDPNRETAPGYQPHEFVVVFSVNTTGTPETIIVPARADGSAIVMNRLPGSVVGIADHAGALWAAGGFAHGEPYAIVVPEAEEPLEVEEPLDHPEPVIDASGEPAEPVLTNEEP